MKAINDTPTPVLLDGETAFVDFYRNQHPASVPPRQAHGLAAGVGVGDGDGAGGGRRTRCRCIAYGRSRWSSTRWRARRSCVIAAMMSQVQRSACSGVPSDGVVQRRVFLANRKVCSMSKRRRQERQHTDRDRVDRVPYRAHVSHLFRGERLPLPAGVNSRSGVRNRSAASRDPERIPEAVFYEERASGKAGSNRPRFEAVVVGVSLIAFIFFETRSGT